MSNWQFIKTAMKIERTTNNKSFSPNTSKLGLYIFICMCVCVCVCWGGGMEYAFRVGGGWGGG